MLNLGYLLTPFHNMVLVSPALSEQQAGWPRRCLRGRHLAALPNGGPPREPRPRQPARRRPPISSEAEAFLAAHPEITAFDLVLIDLNGIARGKIIRRHELLPIFRSGRHLPGSILGLDVTGEDVEETGLVWSDGDADRRAWPIAGSLVPLPWTSPPRGELRLALFELDGTPMAADPAPRAGAAGEAARGRRPPPGARL
jgi:hypothetical protein